MISWPHCASNFWFFFISSHSRLWSKCLLLCLNKDDIIWWSGKGTINMIHELNHFFYTTINPLTLPGVTSDVMWRQPVQYTSNWIEKCLRPTVNVYFLWYSENKESKHLSAGLFIHPDNCLCLFVPLEMSLILIPKKVPHHTSGILNSFVSNCRIFKTGFGGTVIHLKAVV